jgi:beta-galactosidase/beta-glucuronidase
LLNGKPYYLKMVLDQGYWPDGILAAPTDEALKQDILMTKNLGFNGSRKHQKIEDPRWLYWCDKLGLLVWGEMANARDWSLRAEESLASEWERAVRRDYNHPCIVTWVPVNESWGFNNLHEGHPGQYAFLERIVALTRRLDRYRPVIDNDGWDHTDTTDIASIHDYTKTAEEMRARYRETLKTGAPPDYTWAGINLFTRGSKFRGQPVILTEVGGFLMIPQDIPAEQRDDLYRHYGSFTTPEDLFAKYKDLMEGIASLPFAAGFCYTQLTDIHPEINGLLTEDRQYKIPPEKIKEVHDSLFK